MAALCNEGDPESAFMDVTWPEVSTRASNVTLSELLVANSGNAFGEAIARTDLINFGGTIPASSEGGVTETSAALLNDGAERFAAIAATSCFSSTGATSAVDSDADLASSPVSGSASAEGFPAPDAADCGAACKAAVGGVVGTSFACKDLPESGWALAVF